MKYPKLPKAFKRKWVAALRSGKYKQGSGLLYNEGRMCCLGVAGRICGISKEALRRRGMPADLSDGALKKFPTRLRMPRTADCLAKMNDGVLDVVRRKTFPQIATWIEKHL